jgi:hypothetical protein
MGHVRDAELLLDDEGTGEVDETATLVVIELGLVEVELDDPEVAADPPTQSTPGK